MSELTLLLTLIGGLFLLTGWLDERVNKKDFSKYTIKFGIVLFCFFFLTLAILVSKIIDHLILKIC
jgi:hypothetical protein